MTYVPNYRIVAADHPRDVYSDVGARMISATGRAVFARNADTNILDPHVWLRVLGRDVPPWDCVPVALHGPNNEDDCTCDDRERSNDPVCPDFLYELAALGEYDIYVPEAYGDIVHRTSAGDVDDRPMVPSSPAMIIKPESQVVAEVITTWAPTNITHSAWQRALADALGSGDTRQVAAVYALVTP